MCEIRRVEPATTEPDSLGREIVQTLQAAEEILRDYVDAPLSSEAFRRLVNLRWQVERVNARAGLRRRA